MSGRMRAHPDVTRGQARSRGQALTEFALTAPIFFLLVFAVIQLGIIYGAQNGFVDGVRNAARRAATYRVNELTFTDNALKATICAAVEQALDQELRRAMPGYIPAQVVPTDGSDPSPITYRWTLNPDDSTYFLAVDIAATYRHLLYVPLVAWFLDSADGTGDGTLALSAREQMRIENPPQPPPSGSEQTCP